MPFGVSWIRSPLLHFFSLGLLLFLLDGGILNAARAIFPTTASLRPVRIEIDAERIALLEQDFASQMGRAPDDAEREALLDREIDEELLYHEALALGLLERDGGVQTRLIQKMLFLDGSSRIEDAAALLHRAWELGLEEDDIVVRRILVQKMRLYGSALEETERPSPEQIERRYTEVRDSFREPDRLTLVQVFLNGDQRRETLDADAAALRKRLHADAVAPEAAIAMGDPFPLGHELASQSERDLARSFGSGFAGAVFALETSRWSQPIDSAYGRHLVWIDSKSPGSTPPLETVSERVRSELERELGEAKLRSLLGDLRRRYEVVLLEASEGTG